MRKLGHFRRVNSKLSCFKYKLRVSYMNRVGSNISWVLSKKSIPRSPFIFMPNVNEFFAKLTKIDQYAKCQGRRRNWHRILKCQLPPLPWMLLNKSRLGNLTPSMWPIKQKLLQEIYASCRKSRCSYQKATARSFPVPNMFRIGQFRGTDKFQRPSKVHLINHLKPIRCKNLKIEDVYVQRLNGRNILWDCILQCFTFL